jgi:hypothetical protein
MGLQLPLLLTSSTCLPSPVPEPCSPAANDDETRGAEGAKALESQLRARVGPALALTITDNRRTMLSIRRAEGVRHIRLHHMFVDAPEPVLDAVGRYLTHGDRRAASEIDRYVRAHRDRVRPQTHSTAALRASGSHHDLDAIRGALVREHFHDLPPVGITWGRPTMRTTPRGSRTIRLGVYVLGERLIRIHPVLDQAWVPGWFVGSVVFHELLHHAMPSALVNGRRCHHPPEFRRREREFPDHARALAWERRNLHRLLATRHP